MRKRRYVILLVVCLVLIAAGTVLVYVLRQAWQELDNSPVAVIRVSEATFKPLTKKPVDTIVDVNDTVLDAHMTGTAHTKAQASIVLVPNKDEACLKIVLKGQSISNTTGTSGPANLSCRCVTDFVATKLVYIDRLGFHSRPAIVKATSDPHTVPTGSKFGDGMLGRVVDKVAVRRIAESKGESDRVSAKLAEKRVAKGFDGFVDKYLDGLNRSLVANDVFKDYQKNGGRLRFHYSTTANYLMVSIMISDVTPKVFPEFPMDENIPIDICIHAPKVGRVLPLVGKTLELANRAVCDLFLPIAAQERTLSKALNKRDISMAVKFRKNWLNIELGRRRAINVLSAGNRSKPTPDK